MKRIKAGALQFVLFIGVVIAVLLFTFVMLSHTHSFFGKKTKVLINTVKQTDLALDYAMKSSMVFNDSVPIDLDLDTHTKLQAIKEYWGIYEKYTVTAKTKKNTFTKIALVGSNTEKDFPALFVKENQRPLIIVGKTKITGDAYIPKQGIRPGNIAGHSYNKSSLIFGNTRTSATVLPKIASTLKTSIVNTSSNTFKTTNNIPVSLENNSTLSNSFKEPTKYIYGAVINLSGVSLTGNIIVQASEKISVDASAKLQDILLIAPEIEFKNNAEATLQAFASRSIKVGKNCTLHYPSALVVHKKEKHQKNTNTRIPPSISINANTTIKGVVLYLDDSKEQQFNSHVKIDTNALIIGELYCTQNLEHKGAVMGSVTTNNFVALENGSIYQNHLYNGIINSDKLSSKYAGLLLEHKKTAKAISKWLY